MAGSVVVPDLEITFTEKSRSPIDIFTADAVSYEIDLRCLTDLFGNHIIKAVLQELNGRSGSQIGTTDTDYHQNLRIISNLLCRLLNSRKLFLIVVYRQVYPAGKIISGSRSS